MVCARTAGTATGSRTASRLRRSRRDEGGIAALEAGLVTMVLSPMLGGVLWFGNYFWQQQAMYVPSVTQSQVVGAFADCQNLVQQVKQTVLANVVNASDEVHVGLDDVVVEVVDFVPDQIGVDVRISVRTPLVGAGVSWLLPNDGDVVSEVLTRLENASLTVPTCG